jgi:hypothetical protein
MSKTSDSWNQLSTTVTQDWNNSAFSVDLSSAKSASTPSLKKIASNASSVAISGLGTSLSYLQASGADLAGVFSTDQYKEVGDAAASAALNYLNSKIQKIKDAWLTPKTITVKALIGEVAPYATNITKAGSVLSERLKSIMNTDSIEDTLSNIGFDFLSDTSSSSELTSAISNLKAVQAYGNVLNSAGTIIKTAQKVMTVLEPILPVAEITSNFAMSIWSGGASANEATNSLAEQVEKYVQQLLSLTLQSFRKLIYNIPISLPALLVGAINSVSIKNAVSSFMTKTGSSTKTGQWLESVFSEKYYQETLSSLEWEKAINKSLKDTLGTVDNWSDFDFGTNEDGTNKTRGDLLKTKFLNNIVQNYMYGSNGRGGIVAKARASAHIVSYNSSDIGFGTSTGGSSLIISSTQNIGETTSEASASSSESTLDYVLNDSSEENPLKDAESIRLISKKLYESY